jgi:hypothetical protein
MSDRRRYLDSRAEARRQSLPVYSVKINGKRKPRRDLRRVARCAFGRKSREHEKSKHTPTAVPWRGSQSTRPETSREEENQTQKPAARALQPRPVLTRHRSWREKREQLKPSGKNEDPEHRWRRAESTNKKIDSSGARFERKTVPGGELYRELRKSRRVFGTWSWRRILGETRLTLAHNE